MPDPSLSLASLLVCRNLCKDKVFASLKAYQHGDADAASVCVAHLIAAAEKHGLHGNLLRAYLLYRLTHEANLVSTTIEQRNCEPGPGLRTAFLQDIRVLHPYLVRPASHFFDSPLPLLDTYEPTQRRQGDVAFASLESDVEHADTPEDFADALLRYYHHYGYGDIATYRAFCWDAHCGRLRGIRHFESQRLDDLIGYASQKEQLVRNTEAFLAHHPANNVLLTGARGTGKSSGVKALANEYYEQGLRLVQITKEQFPCIPIILEEMRSFASKRFILFLDDLSFEENDAAYKFLKSAIEGSVESRPENVLIYATSNRRHLIRETWQDRSDDVSEIRRADSVNETISLSDRFGLVIYYPAPTQDVYLAMIRHKLSQHDIDLSDHDLRIAGVRWEMEHSGRSGRAAQQFVDAYLGERAANQKQN